MSQRKKLQNALRDTATELFLCEFPQLEHRVSLRIRNFSGGDRFQVQSNGEGVEVTLYVCARNAPEMPEIIKSAGKAAVRITEERVSIRKVLLEKLAMNSPLTPKETKEVVELLRK